MTVLEAARQALPGIDWGGDDDQVSAANAGGPVITIWRSADKRIYAALAYSEIAPLSYPSPEGLAMDLRGDLERHRDLLAAVLGVSP